MTTFETYLKASIDIIKDHLDVCNELIEKGEMELYISQSEHLIKGWISFLEFLKLRRKLG